MLVLQIKTVQDSIRFRWSEWVVSGGMIVWGYVVVAHDALANTSWLTLIQWAYDIGLDRTAWGWLSACIGLFRIFVLLRNGRWIYGPRIRVCLAWAASGFWAALIWALWKGNGVNTGVAAYLIPLAADFGIIYISSYDAQRYAEARRNGGP